MNISSKDEKPKGPRPASVVSSLISEEERLVVCIKKKDVKYDQQFCYQHDFTEGLAIESYTN